jgi:murein DD-endopeptidase MepM/ murein hydrolase activator NlpD
MKRVVSILLFSLPLCLWAKEDGMAENAVPLVEQPMESGAESLSEVPAETAENPAGTVELTETVENPAGAVELTEAEKLIQQELAEIEAENLETEDVAEADSLAVEGEDGAESESGAESEEADAELAADMAAADSASADSAVKSLFLDMTASAMPSESRRISGPYGIRTYRMHRGVDLGLCHGEDRTIVAAFAGKVVKTRNQGRRRGYGKYVILDHGNGLTTLYAHLSKWNVKVGDTLQAGDTIGIGGNTGRSFGAHLHFEMRYNGLYIDPSTVFDFENGKFRWEQTEIDPVALQANEDFYQKELSKHRYYKVRRGDCLGKIARKYGISIRRLKQLNGLKSNMIRPGQVLRCS